METFCDNILQIDMDHAALSKQHDRYGKVVKKLLPEDSSSVANRGTIFFPQLTHTVGDLTEKFWHTIMSLNNSEQDKSVVCAAAASGMGKTHLAYAIGSIQFTILIRVMSNDGALNGEQETGKTAPWNLLLTFITESCKKYEGIQDCGSYEVISKRAKCALRIVHILVYSYIDVSMDALHFAANSTLEQQREFLLRFHRNGKAEQFVAERFRRNVADLLEADKSVADYICETKFNVFRDQVLRKAALQLRGSPLIFCIDEINGLSDDFEDVFMKRSTYDRWKQDGCKIIESSQCSRGLLYATLCCFLSISRKSAQWTVFMTGTSFTISQFRSELDGISVVRGSTAMLSPTKLFEVSDMMEILQHYFNLDDTAKGRLASKLSLFRGRPLFFVKGVLEPLYNRLRDGQFVSKEELSYEDFENGNWLDLSYGQLVGQYRRTYSQLFYRKAKPIPDSFMSTRSLLIVVIQAFLCDGSIKSSIQRDLIEAAVITGMLPLAINTHEEYEQDINLHEEPIIKEALFQIIMEMLHGTDGVKMLLSILSDIPLDKGKKSEYLFQTFVALKVMSSPSKAITLYQLLSELLPENQRQYLPACTEEYICECNILKTQDAYAQQHAHTSTFLRCFLHSDGVTYDTNIILSEISVYAGVDIAFLVRHKVNREDIRVVAVQAKNKISGTLDDCLTTLNPGTQYLTNQQRNQLIDCIYCDEVINRDKLAKSDSQLVGFEKQCWNDHTLICNAHPNLGNQWFRVALTAREIDETLLKQCNDLCDENTHRFFVFRSMKKYKTIATSLCQSPIIPLSITSPGYLTKTGLAKVMDEPKGLLSVPKKYRKWIQITVDDVKKAIK